MWLHLPYKKVVKIVSEYEQYFEENKDTPQEELIAQCGDVELIISEQLGGMPITRLPIRIILLLVMTVIAHYQLFVRVAFPLSTSTPFNIAVFTLMMVLIIAGYALIMGGAVSNISKKMTRKLVCAYIVNAVIALFIGIAINIVFLNTVHDQKIFETLDAMSTSISPSNIGYIFATFLEIFNLLFIVTAAVWALMSVRVGFYALPAVCANLSLCTFFTACARFLSQLSSPEDIERQLSTHVLLIVLEIVIKFSVCTVLCLVLYRIIRRKNARTA